MIQKTQDELAHISTTIHKLKGSPFTLLITLAICGGPMNNLQFQLITGYSAGTVTSALKKLTLHRMVVDTGRAGWVLSDGMRQLPLFTEAMLGSGKQEIIDAGGGEGNEDRKIYDLPPSSSSSLNTTHSLGSEEEEEKQPQDRKNCDLPRQPVEKPVDNPQTAEIKHLLITAGIAPKSRKFREIIAANPDPAYIQAHVLYFEWWQGQRQRDPRAKTIDGRTRFTTGTLITRILDNDPAPPLRCPDCGRVQTNCLCEIIER